MQDKINEIINYTKEKLERINSSAECQNLRVEILGKSGKITGLFRFMKEVPAEEKGKVGAMLNNAKTEAESLISAKETKVDLRMQDLQTEQGVINQMIQSIQKQLNDNVERTMNIFT